MKVSEGGVICGDYGENLTGTIHSSALVRLPQPDTLMIFLGQNTEGENNNCKINHYSDAQRQSPTLMQKHH